MHAWPHNAHKHTAIQPCSQQHLKRLLRLILTRVTGMIKIANEIEVDGMRIRIRVGIHMGPAVAAVVGRRVPRYTLFG